MFTMNYQYRIYPSIEQETRMDSWLEMLRGVFNYALRERKDWIQSRKCAINACSLSGEYIVAADTPYPDYYKQQNALTAAKKALPQLKDIQSQVIQEPLRRVDAAFVARKERGHGFPRFKKFGQYRSFLFPQFKENPVVGSQIKLPKLGLMSICVAPSYPRRLLLSRRFAIIRKPSGWYATLCIQADVSIPDVAPHGRSLGIDVGLEYFLSTSDGLQVERPRFFCKLQTQA